MEAKGVKFDYFFIFAQLLKDEISIKIKKLFK